MARPRSRGSIDVIVIVGLAVALLVAIAVVAVRRLDTNPLATPTPYPTATPSPSVSATARPNPSSTANQYDAGQAFAQAQAFYAAYQQDSSSLAKYLSPQLAAQLTAGGSSAAGVYCTFNVPSSMSFNPPTATGNAATVVADESFVNNPDINVTLTISLSTLLITAITCPQ